MTNFKWFLLAMLVFTSGPRAHADGGCSNELPSAMKMMGEKHNATAWIETTANDGKPLYIQLASVEGKLRLAFFKTREGAWADGSATVCPEKGKLIAKISKKDMVVGKAAPRLIRWGFGDGADFTLKLEENGELKISTFGWGGTFKPSTEAALSEARAALESTIGPGK